MTDRLSLCLPIDVARLFDSQVSQAQLEADTFQNSSDDIDLLKSWIEDAEDELRQRTDEDMRVGRVGVGDSRESYEHINYKLSGHKAYRRSFSHYTFDYDYDEVTVNLEKENIIPFDASEGDAVYVYRGLGGGDGSSWDDITDQQDSIWAIVDHISGKMNIHPVELHRALMSRYGRLPSGTQRLTKLRLAVSYRYGGLGGSRKRTSKTELGEEVTDTQTGTVSVSDGSRFPTSRGDSVIFKLGDEYIRAVPDATNDSIDVLERGVRGTTAASHSTEDALRYTPPSIRKAVASRAGMQLINSSQYRSWLPDSEAELSESDMLDSLESTWDTTIEAMS